MKHIKERKNLQREFEKDKDLKPKASTELWTLRKTEKTLAAQKRFGIFWTATRYPFFLDSKKLRKLKIQLTL